MSRLYFNKNRHWITIIGVAVISFLVYLGWKLGIAISFAVLSIFVSAFFASRSLKLTRDSLELTRATTRPFLTVTRAIYLVYEHNCEIKFLLCNTGPLPAYDISVAFEFKYLSQSIENSDARSFLHDIQTQQPLSPREERECVFTLIPQTQELIVTHAERCLTFTIEYHFNKWLFHDQRKFFVPIEVGKLDRGFSFLTVPKTGYWL
jgi:hypothetical protein